MTQVARVGDRVEGKCRGKGHSGHWWGTIVAGATNVFCEGPPVALAGSLCILKPASQGGCDKCKTANVLDKDSTVVANGRHVAEWGDQVRNNKGFIGKIIEGAQKTFVG